MPTSEQKISALRQAAHSAPEYADIAALFIGLYGFVNGREQQTGIEVVQTSSALKKETENSAPLLDFSDLQVDQRQTVSFLLGIVEVLSTLGQENVEYLALLATALKNGALDPAHIYGALWERNRAPVLDVSDKLGIPAALLDYIFEIPLKTALEQYAGRFGADSFNGWQRNVCPVCGSRAGMSELTAENGHRFLSCATCSFCWPFKRLSCAYCGCDDPEKLSYFTAGNGSTRVDTCTACSRYIKTRDSRKGYNEAPLEVEDLLTIHLDLLASREGFERGK